MGLTSTTIPGFQYENNNYNDTVPDDVDLPPEIYLPNTTQDGKMPKSGDVPFIADFDDSGLDIFLEHEFTMARANLLSE